MGSVELLARLVLLALSAIALLLPAWHVAGRLQRNDTAPLFRFVVAAGLALVGYLTAVNLAGRALENSTGPALAWLAFNALAALVLWRRGTDFAGLRTLACSWRSWIGLLAFALVAGLPQWLIAVSTPFWDEVASSAIHVTAANQFAEGVFPPRHNAFPEIAIKYHYAFTLLSGTLTWIGGFSANNSIDIASTALWLFVFGFAFLWMRDLGLGRAPAAWASIATLLGGGLAWLYLPQLEAHSGFDKSPPETSLLHRYDPAQGVWHNLVEASRPPSAYLRNGDGTLSNLPWDIAAQFQQHAVAIGLAVTLLALYLFVGWQNAAKARRGWLLAAIATFGLAFLAHAVFGGVAAVAGGTTLLLLWLRDRRRPRFVDGLVFTLGVAAVAFAHGGLMSTGAEYGASADVFTLRDEFGYAAGGIVAFVNWNIAGFGVVLILALAAVPLRFVRALPAPHERPDALPTRATFELLLWMFTGFSYLLPQFAYYSAESAKLEQFTEISKFFFPAHLGLALLSSLCIARLPRVAAWFVCSIGSLAMLVTPLAFCFGNVMEKQAGDSLAWKGFYRSPYYRDSIEESLARSLRQAKSGARDVYFDSSADERRHGYLSEMLVFGGSLFTLTPSRYERTGIGYRLSENAVAQRFIENGQMAMLTPGASACCDWYYARPSSDTVLAPLIVRSRLAKLLDQAYLLPHASAGPRTLYRFARGTEDLDEGIDQYVRPHVVAQLDSDTNGDGLEELVFFDLRRQRIILERTGVAAVDSLSGHRIAVAREEIGVPEALRGQSLQLLAGRFGGDDKLDILVGRLADTEYSHGARIEEIVERSEWAWTYRDSRDPTWDLEYRRWLWDGDTPLIAALGEGGTDVHIAYRRATRTWLRGNRMPLSGPALPEDNLPMPFAGRFSRTDRADLGLWGVQTGVVSILTAAGTTAEVRIDIRPEDVLLPADYDGDGLDELAYWRPSDQRWSIRSGDGHETRSVRFGAADGIPIPADYDGDGRVDLGIWEPSRNRILVSFDFGRSLGREVEVPADSVPLFVNLY